MADAAITKAPVVRPSYMTTPKRQSGGSRELKVSWKNPSSATDRNNSARATGIKIIWDLVLVSISDSKKTLTRHFDEKVGDNTLTNCTLNLNAFRSREFPNEIWTRDTFYPGTTDASHEWTGQWCLKTVRCGVYYYNAKGTGPGTVTSMNWQRPFATSVARPVQSAETGHVDCKVATPKGEDHLEIHSGWWTRTVYDSRTKKTSVSHGKVTRGSSVNVAYDVTDRQQLTYDQYVRFTVSAFTRGYWGNSETRTQTLYISYPREPKITGVSIPSKGSSDKVTVLVNTQQATKDKPQHPVTGTRIQVLKSSPYSSESQIPSEAEWEDLDVQDDGDCTALACTVSEVKPSVDTYSWIRIKTWNQHENIHYRYSKPYRLKTLETKSPTASGDGCTITTCAAGKDGTSVVVTTTYDEDNRNTGTEITWSKYSDAWTSTDQPDTFDATWKSNTSTETRDGVVYYKGTVKITVRGLEPTTTYYFRARRYLDLEGNDRTFSSWSNKKECTTLADPEDPSTSDTKPKPRPDSVSLQVPNYTPRGDDMDVTWTFQPDSSDNVDDKLAEVQTAWELFVPAGVYTVKAASGSTPAKKNPEWNIGASVKKDAKGAYTIPYADVQKTLAKITSTLDGVKDEIQMRVRVKTSGEWRESSTRTARIADVPELDLYTPECTVQPHSIDFYCSHQARLDVVVRAHGASGEMPYGIDAQAEGDTIWSGRVTPKWTEFDATSTAQYAQLQQDLIDAQSTINVTTRWYGCMRPYDMDDAAYVAWRDMTNFQPGLSMSETTGTNKYELLVPKPMRVESVSGLYASTWSGSAWGVFTSVSYTKSLDNASDASWSVITVTFPSSSLYQQWVNGTLALALDAVTYDKDAQQSALTAQQAIDDYLARALDYVGTVTPPAGLNLWDGCTYDVSATATDTTTRLVSDAATGEFGVEWSRQAPVLGDGDVTVTPHDTYDEAGNHQLTATIEIGERNDFLTTDAFDIYRVTVDGPYPIYSDARAGQTITDPYAPYCKRGNLAYRVCIRTSDGDMAWHDYQYELRYHALRVEFGSRHVELPYNVVPTDAYSKDFEARRYMDGSIDGFWNAGAMRTSGFTTDLIKIYERERLDAVRALAHYAGACYIRTAEGCAFTANVNVNSIGTDFKSLAYGVSLDVTEVEMADEYKGIDESAGE